MFGWVLNVLLIGILCLLAKMGGDDGGVRSSRSHMLFKIDVLKNFAIFTEKHLC